jgi:cytochrome c oxidase subunit 2
MDAVPGIPTTMWFTPKFTTNEMKDKTGNSNFAYEISCDQMCGNGHYSMKGIIQVVTQEEYDAWMAKQKPYYFAAFPEKDPTAAPAAPATPGTVPLDSANTSGTVAVRSGASQNKLK